MEGVPFIFPLSIPSFASEPWKPANLLSFGIPSFLPQIQASRKGELRSLAVRKYLDALCVYLWACTGQLFSTFTFGLVAAGGGGISPGSAFAALALFQGLITPLNALPWVINGEVDARN